MSPVLEYDANGKLVNIVLAANYSNNYINHPNILNQLQGYNSGSSYTRLEDGSYLFTTGASSIWSPTAGSSEPAWVILANGEVETIDPEATFLVYLVNKDSKVEWVRQYKGIRTFGSYKYVDSYLTEDGKYWMFPTLADGSEFEDLETGDVYQFDAPNGVNFLKVEILDAVQASGPEAYTLNIENKRKEYKITATSNAGGEIVATNPDNGQNVVSTTGETTTLETVKYGDTNKYDIKIIPDSTYLVAGVQVNGEDVAYKVNNDGSVTLDKITDIQEDKSITITYDRNKSQVIIKHYLKDTTDSVFGDEILIGEIDDPYETEPKSSELYSLATDSNGEIILPSNMTGNFAATPTTVIYYYVENEVELKVNYYVDGTEIELAPSNVQRKVLGSSYQTAPLAIDNYNLIRTIGDENGTLTRNITEVTYMYSQLTDVTITIRYVDKATNQDLVTPITKTVQLHDPSPGGIRSCPPPSWRNRRR